MPESTLDCRIGAELARRWTSTWPMERSISPERGRLPHSARSRSVSLWRSDHVLEMMIQVRNSTDPEEGPPRNGGVLAPRYSGRLADHSRVGTLGVRCKSVNFWSGDEPGLVSGLLKFVDPSNADQIGEPG